MSHELRTPLNAILGFSSLLRDSGVSEDQRKDLDIINRSGEHLLHLIDTVLDLAKVDAGRIEVQIEPCDVKRLVRDVTEMISIRANRKNLALRVNGSGDFPQFVKTDADKLRQVLINLLDNAVKFTARGFVELRLNGKNIEDGKRIMLICDVEDTGMGISPEDQQRIFDPFVQAKNRGNEKGTGLGLTISRQFVQLMGGTLEVSSELGTGTRFRLVLPVEPVGVSEMTSLVAQEEPTAGIVPDRPDYRVLIVEDVEENRLVLKRLMENVGFEVRLANDGAQAVEAFQSWRPHFVWMDMRMPVMDGKEAVRRIRALDGGLAVKIIAVTASVSATDREEVLAAGLDDFLRKPFRAKEIFDCMSRHLGVRFTDRAVPVKEHRDPPSSLRGEDLAALPAGLREELEEALLALDRERIDRAVCRISEQNAIVGKTLARLADAFSYTPIYLALESSKAEPPGPPEALL
jgi:CheY-like chemotaxis protein